MKIKANIINHNQSFFGEIEIRENKIYQVSQISNDLNKKFNYLMPGFVDSHTHGGYGLDFNNISKWNKTDFDLFEKNINQEGITSVAFTTVTTSINNLNEIAEWFKSNNIDFILAWHIEGPFISKSKKGAHNESEIIHIDYQWIKNLVTKLKDKKIILTSALEENNNADKLQKIKSENFFVSLGHSNANFNQVKNFLKNKIFDRYTHLFNAMSGFEHRNPGVAFAAFALKDGYAELIADGQHVNNELLKYTFDNIGSNRIILVSDSLSLKGCKDGKFLLGKLVVEKKGDLCFVKDTSTIAGSCYKYNDIVKNFFTYSNCNLEDIVKVTSYNYFKSINLLENYGEIKEGKIADLVLIDKNFNIVSTFKNGMKVFNLNEK